MCRKSSCKSKMERGLLFGRESSSCFILASNHEGKRLFLKKRDGILWTWLPFESRTVIDPVNETLSGKGCE